MKELSSQRWRSGAALSFLIMCCAVTELAAHSDPRGDVYPNVKIERGNFVIDFKNNDGEPDFEDTSNFRMIYSPDGILLSPRHRHGKAAGLNETLGYPAKNEAHLPNEVISFDRGHIAQPTYILEKDGRKEEHRLAWPDNSKNIFEAVAADADSICVASITNGILFLNHFDRRRFALPETVQITAPETLSFIWDFPVVSNLVQVNGRYCIAWPRYNRKASRFECIISTWRPGEKEPVEIVLDTPADWNTHLSLAVIGDRLCLAYHTLTGEYNSRSTILTAFRTISNN